jgi:hypothetical protein
MFIDDSPCPAIAAAFSLFHGAKPDTFAELLVEHLTEHGWVLTRVGQKHSEPPYEEEPE